MNVVTSFGARQYFQKRLLVILFTGGWGGGVLSLAGGVILRRGAIPSGGASLAGVPSLGGAVKRRWLHEGVL